MSKERKKFKDSAVGKFLKQNVPDLLDAADDFFPPIGILTAAVKGKNLSPELQSEFDKLALDYEQNERRDYLADVQNARAMQVEALRQEDKFSKRYVYYLSSFVIASATGFGVMMFFVDFPESNRRLVEMFADIYLFSGAMIVLNFFFGSSKGSQDKDQHIIKTLQK